jgi:predicted nucleic acid-binding protein
VVLDASALLELLLGTKTGGRVEARVASARAVHVPHLIDVEVASALRRLMFAKEVGEARAGDALADLLALPLERHPHAWLLPRAWALRQSVTSYDAIYLALAEALGEPLLTTDAKLSRAHGHRAVVELA